MFVKDYDTLKRFIDGKSLSLQEQIENEAKNSEDGCVNLQMIIPNYNIDKNYRKLILDLKMISSKLDVKYLLIIIIMIIK